MKRVLIFSHEWPPFLGGVGTVGALYAKWFTENDFEVTVVTRKQEGICFCDGITIHEVDTKPFFWFASYRKWFDEFDLSLFDVILLNECAPTISASSFFSDEIFNKTYVVVHGLEVENIYRMTFSNFLRRLFLFKRKHFHSCLRSKGVIFVGEFIKNKFIAELPVKYTTEIERKSQIIRTGSDMSVFFLQDYAENNKTFNIVSASRITLMKGYLEKLNIIKKLVDKNVDVIWHVCGDGDYLEELKRISADTGLSKNIIFYGACSKKELNDIYAKCQVYLLLSRYDEALPLTYIESQLSGLFSIGYNKGGVIETIVSSETGKLVNDVSECYSTLLAMANKVDTLIANKQLIAKSASVLDITTTLSRLNDL